MFLFSLHKYWLLKSEILFLLCGLKVQGKKWRSKEMFCLQVQALNYIPVKIVGDYK